MRVRARLVGSQLDQTATALPTLIDGPNEHGFANLLAPAMTGNPDSFDLSTLGPSSSKTRNDGKLQRSNLRAVCFSHAQHLIGIGINLSKGVKISLALLTI